MNPLDLNVNLSEVKTGRPVLPKAQYRMIISETEIAENSKGTGYNLRVQFATVNPETDEEGTLINPGFPVFRYYPLQQSDNPKAPDFRVDIKRLLNAAFGCDDDSCPEFNEATVADLKGQEVLVSLKVRDDEEYGRSNDVSRVEAV